MGRLFWKFFLFFWFAQLVTSVAVGVAFYLEHRNRDWRPAAQSAAASGLPAPPSRLALLVPRGLLPPAPSPGLGRDFRIPLLPILIGSIVSLLFAALLAWYFAKPIRSLRRAIGEVAAGRVESRVGASIARRQDELSSLGADFDHMAERLQSLLETQRRLFHDVSHELRSPLARIQAAVGLMRQQPERTQEIAGRIERDSSRLDTLVEELLTLARLDSGLTERLDGSLDLRDIIDDVLTATQVEAEVRTVTVVASAPEPLPVCGNSELLYRAIENVVRNAVSHSPPGAWVEIDGRAAFGRVFLSVSDSGPGVLESELAHIFKPFVRGPAVSSTDGHGLGLAITRRVMEIHGGQATAANRPSGGLVVLLDIPVANDSPLASANPGHLDAGAHTSPPANMKTTFAER